MSTLQVANVWLESTANNRISYPAANTMSVVAGGVNTFVANSSTTMVQINSANVIVANSTTSTFAVNGAASITANTTKVTFIDTVNLPAGNTTQAPILFNSGTNLSSATAGALEYDGSNFYGTAITTNGRGMIPTQNVFRLGSSLAAIGPTIGDFFGSASTINLPAGVFDIDILAYFTKTTAGTATWTLTTGSSCSIFGYYIANPITGIAAGAITSGYTGSAAGSIAFAASGSLTTAVNHSFFFKVKIITTTTNTFKLQLTQSAGTATPLAGSYYAVTPIANSVGSFV